MSFRPDCAHPRGVARPSWRPANLPQSFTVEAGTSGECLACDPEALGQYDNMVKMNNLNEPVILHNLRARFKAKKIYTYIGNILIAVNPFELLAIYTPDILDKYKDGGGRSQPPHIYAIADFAYQGMIADGASQSVVISGESGAGKTETMKLVLQFLAEASGRASGKSGDGTKQDSLEQQILKSNPVMEAFGNAKTTRNNNSSRFGKWTEILFNSAGAIVGGSIINYLLEKSRIPFQAEQERNYHAFYQLLAGGDLDPDVKRRYKLKDAEDFHYMNQSGVTTVDMINDEKDWLELNTAMDVLDMSDEDKESVFRVTAAVLHLGDIVFQGEGGDEDVAEAKPTGSLPIAAELLGVGEAALTKCLTKKRITGSTFKNYSVSSAADARDGLSKAVYSQMFDWLIGNINRVLGGSAKRVAAAGAASGKPATLHIGILDIFGFEWFRTNSFEQLCINYCNEKLQFHFNEHIFKLEQKEYESEGISVDAIDFADNQPTLDLLEVKVTGIFAMIDEECNVPRGSDEGLLSKLIKQHESHPNFERPKPKELDARKVFKVLHYAAVVPYNTTGFLDKNRDSLADDIAEVLGASSHTFVAGLLQQSDGEKAEAAAGGRRKKKGKASLGFKFKGSLNDLMTRLNATAPHFVRCMKPNHLKKGGVFESDTMLDQLRNAGLLEVCRIRQIGFPMRKSFEDFLFRYRCLDLTAAKDHLTLLAALEAKGVAKKGQWAVGHSKVFMRNQQQNDFEEYREEALKDVVTHMTTLARRFLCRCRYHQWGEILATLRDAVTSRTEEALNEALIDAPELPLGGDHIAVVREAKALRERIQEEARVLALIQEAIAGRELADLKASVAQAAEMDPEFEPAERSTAEALIATIERERACVASLKQAAETKDKSGIVAALADAVELGSFVTDTEEYATAVATKKRIEEEEKATAELRAAIASREFDALVRALDNMTEMGLGDEPVVAEGNALRETLRAHAEARSVISAAVADRQLGPLSAALRKAKEVNLDDADEAVVSGKALERRLLEEEAVESELGDAVKANDISALETALAHADAISPPFTETVVDSDNHPKARRLLAKLREIEACKAEMVEACKLAQFGPLSGAIRKAAELGIESGPEIERARTLMEELGAQFEQLKALEQACNALDRESIETALAKCKDMGLGEQETCAHAHVTLAKMAKQDELADRLDSAAEACDDKDALRSLLDEAVELNLEARKDKALSVARAAEALALLKRDEDLMSAIKASVKALDAEALAAATSKATTLGVSASVLAEAEEAARQIDETLALDSRLGAALDSKDMDSIISVYEECEAKGVTPPKMAAASAVVKREKGTRETKAMLERAVESGDGQVLREALARATELGVKGAEVDRAKELQDKIASERELASALRAAMKALETKAQSKAGVEPVDIAPLDEAIDEAIANGLAADSEAVSEAQEFKLKMERVLVVQSELAGLLAEAAAQTGSATGVMKRLKKALDKAEDLGMVCGVVRKAKATVRELERARFEEAADDDFEPEDDGIDAEGLQKQREELFAKASHPKFEWTKYNRIRTPDSFASGVYFGKKKIKANQLVWQANVLHKSMTDLPRGLSHVAKNIHKSILGYCGDKTMSFPPMLAANILEKGIEEPAVVDEIYVQVLKHLRDNPNQESEYSAWQLMCMCVGTFPPSRDFESYLLNFLLASRTKSGQPGNYARYALRRLEGTLQSGPSAYIPAPEDIRAYKDRPPILATIELVDGSIVTDELPITPDINVGKVVEICSTFLDITDPRRRSLGIFVVDVDQDTSHEQGFNPLAATEDASELIVPRKTPRPLSSESFLGDVVTVKVRARQEFKFVFKRKIFLDNGTNTSDEAWANLMYMQAVDEIVAGNVPIDEGDDGQVGDTARVVDTVARMFAVDYAGAILAGEYSEGGDASDLAGAVRSAIAEEGIEFYVPEKLRDSDFDWAESVAARLLEDDSESGEAFIELEPEEHVEVVQSRVVDHPMFGACFFDVRKKAFPPSLDAAFQEHMTIAINARGLHFLSTKTRETLQSFGYASVYRWGGSSTQFTIFLFNDDEDNVDEVTMYTSQAPDMASLILDYINAIMASSED